MKNRKHSGGWYVTFDGMSGVSKTDLVGWLSAYLKRQKGKSVALLHDKRHDRLRLRELGQKVLPWCDAHGVNRSDFTLPLFAANAALLENFIDNAVRSHNLLLRDRSFVSSLGYVSALGSYAADTIWDLYVNVIRCRVPDVAIILDADVDTASERYASREEYEVGLGGMMWGNRAQRERLREAFLALPGLFAGRDGMTMRVVRNESRHTEDREARDAHIAEMGHEIVKVFRELKMV